MLVKGHADPRTGAVLDAVSSAYPLWALQRVADAGFVFRIESPNGPLGPSERTQALVGERFARNLWLPEGVGGIADLAWGEITVGGPRNAEPPILQSDAIHEFGHGLDYALGVDGAYRSDEPDVQALFQAVRQAHASDPHGTPRFLSPFFGVDSREFVAESLTTHRATNIKRPRGQTLVLTRADLQKATPDADSLAEQLLAEPPVRSTAQVRAGTVAAVDAGLRKLELTPYTQRDLPFFLRTLSISFFAGIHSGDAHRLEGTRDLLGRVSHAAGPGGHQQFLADLDAGISHALRSSAETPQPVDGFSAPR